MHEITVAPDAALIDSWWPSPFGADDQLGMLNHVTDAKRLQALQLVRGGRIYDLGRVLDEHVPVFPGRACHQTLVTSAHHANGGGVGENKVNWITEVCSGTTQLGTHLDALNHLQIDDRGYNGWTVSELAEPWGVNRLGAETIPQGAGGGTARAPARPERTSAARRSSTRDPVPAARGRLRRGAPPRRSLTGLAAFVRRSRALLRAGGGALRRPRRARHRPNPFPLPVGVMLDEQNPEESRCVRCTRLDGFPCLVDAKADAHVCAIRPALEHPNVTLVRDERIPVAGVAHQCGTVRFGDDPATSALDVDCKAHDLDNLYVVDTSFFPMTVSSTIEAKLRGRAFSTAAAEAAAKALGIAEFASPEAKGRFCDPWRLPGGSDPLHGRPRSRDDAPGLPARRGDRAPGSGATGQSRARAGRLASSPAGHARARSRHRRRRARRCGRR